MENVRRYTGLRPLNGQIKQLNTLLDSITSLVLVFMVVKLLYNQISVGVKCDYLGF